MKKEVTVRWKRSRVTKQVRVARTEANPETRAFYAHNHTLERIHEELVGTVCVTMDLDAIAQTIANNAARNGSGRAIMLGGHITAKRLNERVIATQTEAVPISQGYSELQPDEVKK